MPPLFTEYPEIQASFISKDEPEAIPFIYVSGATVINIRAPKVALMLFTVLPEETEIIPPEATVTLFAEPPE